MSSERVLDTSVSGALNAAGKVTLTIGPRFYGEVWHVTTIAVSTSTTALVPSVHVYRGPPVPGNLLGATYDGGADSDDFSGDAAITLYAGDRIQAQWGILNVGDVGAIATLSIYGRQEMS